jgi:hypothetical protein
LFFCGFSGTHHELLTLLETPQERSQRTNIHGVREHGHEVVQDTGHLAKQCPDPLGTIGELNVKQLLDGQSKALLVGHHGNVIQSIEVRQGLHIGLVLNQFLGTTVKQTDVRIGANDLLAIEFQNQSQHTVGSRMLRTKVDGVVTNLATNLLDFGFKTSGVRVLGEPLVGKVGEARVGRNKSCSLVAGSLDMSARDGGSYGARARHRCVEDGGGAEAEPFGRIARKASEGGGHGGE